MPRPNTPLIHPRVEEELQKVGWYETTCQIMEVSTVKDAAGEEFETPTPLAGHGEIPCRIAPVVGVTGASVMETESADMTTVPAGYIAKLPGYWPLITEKHTAEIDGVVYDIEKVDFNSEKSSTRLTLQDLK